MSYTINFEGDSTEHLAAFLAKLAHSGPWVVKIVWRDAAGDPSNFGDFVITGWQPAPTFSESPKVIVQAWDEDREDVDPDYSPRPIEVEDIAEVTVY